MDDKMSAQFKEAHELSAKQVKLQEIPDETPHGKEFLSGNIQLIKDIKVRVTVSVGAAELSVAELFALKDDSVLKLEADTTDPVEVLLEGKVIARGNLVVVGEKFGVSITEILPTAGA